MFLRMRPAGSSPGVFYGWYVIGAMFFMVLVGVGGRLGFSLFFETWKEEFGVSIVALSAVASAGWAFSGVSQLVMGGLSDRFGGRVVMSVSMLVMGVGTVLMGLATNIWVLALIYVPIVSFAMGGVLFVPTTAVVARWFRRRRGAAMGLLSSGGSVGGMLLVPLMAYLLVLVDWRATWIIVGAIMLLLAFPLLLMVVRNSPREIGLWPDGDDAPPEEMRSSLGTATERRGPLNVDRWRSAYRTAPMWQLTSSYLVCGVTTATISIHFVPFAVAEGISTSTAALAFGVLSLANMLGVITAGILSDRMQRKNMLAVIYAVRGLGFLLLVLLPTSVGLWVFAVVAGASWLASVPQTSALTAEVYGIERAGTLTGMLTMVHQFAGAVAVLLAGVAFTAFDTYAPAFLTAAAMLGFASFTSWTLRERTCSVRFVSAEPRSTLASEGA